MINADFSRGSLASRGAAFLGSGARATATKPDFPAIFGAMKSTVKDVMEQVTERVALPEIGTFGGLVSETLQSSPLGDFLGLGEVPENRIPGGKSLYNQGQGMYHKGAPGAPDTYAFENTPAGIKFAADHDYASIDIDMLITKDGVPVATHWSQPMAKDGFHDPLGKLGKDTKVSDMTLAEVTRLRNADGQSQIYPMSTMIKSLKEHGIAGDLEAKNDSRFATDEVMGSLADQVREAGIKANLKSIERGSVSDDILQTAQEHGFWTRTATGGGHTRRDLGYAN